MYAIAVNGSPCDGGNTEVLLKEVHSPVAEKGWETELVKVGGTAIRGCAPATNAWRTKTTSA